MFQRFRAPSVTVRTLLALVAGGCAAAAQAEVATRLEYQVSPALAETWSSSINAAPGQSIDVRVRISYIGTAAPLGLGAVNYQPTVSNWDSSGAKQDSFGPFANGVGDATSPTGPYGYVPDAPGQYGRIQGFARAGTSTLAFYKGFVNLHNGVNYLRIAHSNVTNWQSGSSSPTGAGGVDSAQWTPGFRPDNALPFDTRLTDIVLAKFNITLSGDTDLRDLIVDTPQELFGYVNSTTGVREARWVANTTEVSGTIVGSIVTSAAAIHVVPSPGVLPMLGAGVVALRRRRR